MPPTMKPPKITPQPSNPIVTQILKGNFPKEKKKKEKKKKEVKRAQVWAVDFDGTIVANGLPNTDLIQALILAKTNGVKLILWTSREGKALGDALQWCKEQGLDFDAANRNVQEYIEKYGYDSRKIGADLYIDDRALCLDKDWKETLWKRVQNL